MDRGDRVIVGGAEMLHRAPIIKRFVELAGGAAAGFAILPCATAEPRAGHERMRGWLAEAGVDPARVELLQVSEFLPGARRGAWEAAELERLSRARGLWILGGDQNRILALLRDEAGRDSPLLAAIRRRAVLPPAGGGLVVGGTSAGAAAMGDPMIGAGTSFGALALPRASGPGEAEMSRALFVQPGLGLFPEGLLDQHFDARARLGRLLEAALVEDGGRRPAFGIAEGTALVREGAIGRLSVTGAASVTVVDPRPARRYPLPTAAGPRVAIRGALLHLLTAGDAFFPGEGRLDFGSKERLGPGGAAFASPRPEASGVLSPYGDLASFAARMLLDNEASLLFLDAETGRRYARSYLIEELEAPDGESRPLGWEIRLGLGGEGAAGGRASRLWYDGRYSFEGVVLDILPIDVRISRPDGA